MLYYIVYILLLYIIIIYYYIILYYGAPLDHMAWRSPFSVGGEMRIWSDTRLMRVARAADHLINSTLHGARHV